MLVPGRVAVIGGGRWARVILEELSKSSSPPTQLLCSSAGNEPGMRDWIRRTNLTGNLSTIPLDRLLALEAPIPVIVANAARDHESAAERLLEAAFPALIEKPLALSGHAAQRLLDLARARSARLATAHVFTFARYLERFARLTDGCGELQSIRVTWTDLAAESRYGENKTYDVGLPIFADVLPHVLSIVNVLLPGAGFSFRGLASSHGGRVVDLELAAGRLPVRVALAREAPMRERIVEVVTSKGPLRLNFTTGPASIHHGAEVSVGDPDWGRRPGPLATMLSAYFRFITGEYVDERLDPALGVDICRAIDAIDPHYRAQQSDWLLETHSRASPAREEDANYALRELLSRDSVVGAPSVARNVSRGWWLRDAGERRELIGSLLPPRVPLSNSARSDP